MSIVVVTFQGAPKPTEEAIKREEELDKNIEKKIKGNVVSRDMHIFIQAICSVGLGAHNS